MRRFIFVAAAAALASLSLPGWGAVSDGKSAPVATVDTDYALVQLNGEPLSTYVKTKPGPGKKIDFNNAAVKSYRAQLSALRNDFKQWLQKAAPKAKITGNWDISLNAVGVKLNGTSLTALRGSPFVTRAEYQGLYRPTVDDPDLLLINAVNGWAAVGGPANAGSNVRVAVIDSGIDQDHPCFNDAGYPAQAQKGQTQYTNNKVIVARVFNNKVNQNGFDAKAVGFHGTHVAGTLACNYQTPAEIDGVTIPYKPSGVAPRALLGNYNIFPGDVDNARSEDILNALDAAYADGMDIANMSLGGNARGNQDLLTVAIDDLDQANMVIAVASGNSGDGDPDENPPLAPGHYTVESPGSAARALTAGASSVGQAIVNFFDIGTMHALALSGDFATISSALTASTAILTTTPVNPAGYSEVCSALAGGSLAGKIAMIGRGTCDFSTKIRYAELAGAVAVIMVNRDPDPIPMGFGTSPDGIQPTIPAYMIGSTDGIAIRTTVANGTAGTITLPQYTLTGDDNIQADFSSQGPTDVDFRVKPDVMAPGVNVISSIPGAYCDGDPNCWAFLNGTSMSTPHLAGAAAVVRGAHPTWSAAQVRSAVVNTAVQGAVTSFVNGAVVTDVNVVGAGLLDLEGAVTAVAAVDPVSTSFGSVPAGSGQSRTKSVTITNLSTSAQTFGLSVNGVTGAGVGFSLSQGSITLAPGASGSVVVTMTSAKGASLGDHQAFLRVSANGSEVAHAALYTFVKN